ncbi:hypothetical protein LCGC14_1070490 [marine sediment metagenome]|uniref:Phage protein Gp37/Gp68 n=1 Tax=marine sediment metagenome TaxID=412755 RepID=A0A0F9N5K1_9ZZZZ
MATGIQYLDEVWNPITGCRWVSPACDNCWARAMTRRLQGMAKRNIEAGKKYVAGFDKVVCHETELDYPATLKKPRVIGTCFMSDLFNYEVGVDFIQAVFDSMINTPRHEFVCLTKRAERLRELVGWLKWPANLWMGVTVEGVDYKNRLDCLSSVPGNTWASFEPLLDDVGDLGFIHLQWAVVGCESGPGARPMEQIWARSIIKQCQAVDVPVFYKQAMIDGKLVSMPTLGGVKYDFNAPAEMLQLREAHKDFCNAQQLLGLDGGEEIQISSRSDSQSAKSSRSRYF